MYILEFISLDIALVTPLMWMENVETRLFRPLLPQENLPRAHEAKHSINKITDLMPPATSFSGMVTMVYVQAHTHVHLQYV